jgi:hypothetical protein
MLKAERILIPFGFNVNTYPKFLRKNFDFEGIFGLMLNLPKGKGD